MLPFIPVLLRLLFPNVETNTLNPSMFLYLISGTAVKFKEELNR